MMPIGVFVVEFSDVFGVFAFGVGSVDQPGTHFDQEVPAGIQQYGVSPGESDAVCVSLEIPLPVSQFVIGEKQRGRYEMTDVAFDHPVSPARLNSYVPPLGVAEFERVDRDRDVDGVVQVDIHIDCDIDVAGGPSGKVGRDGCKLCMRFRINKNRET